MPRLDGKRLARAPQWVRRRLAAALAPPAPQPAARAAATPPPRPAPLDRYADFLPPGPGRRVVLLTDSGCPDPVGELVAGLADDDVFVLTDRVLDEWALEETAATTRFCTTVAELAWILRGIGPVDVVVDLLTAPAYDGVDLWSRLFFHLRADGVWVERHRADRRRPSAAAGLTGFLHQRWSQDEPGRAPGTPQQDELARSVAQVVCDREHLLIRKSRRHYVKLSDAEVGRLLPTRNTRETVTTLGGLGGGHLSVRGPVRSHASAVPIAHLPMEMDYPALRVQHYRGRLALVSNSLLHGDSTVLPPSFRYPLEANRHNPCTVEISPEFARVPAGLRPRKRLEGDFYHLDCWNSGHFGHVMTEVVSRLWGWPTAKEQLPGLKAVFRIRYPNERRPELETTLFTAYGIAASDIVWVDEPVWLSSVVAATPMWQNVPPYFVHPGIREVWGRLRAGLVPEVGPGADRLFVSRRNDTGNRPCRNAGRVEDLFAAHGFTVVYPEELALAEQARLFARARVVAGFAGSALYNLVHADRLEHLVVLGHEAYTARYEHLFASALGCAADYFWSTPDVPHPAGGWSAEAYYSGWAFDFDRNEADLRELFARLPG